MIAEVRSRVPSLVNYIPALDYDGIGTDLSSAGPGAPASGAYPSANRAIFVPFFLPFGETVKRLFYCNGTTGGNGTRAIDLGIYLAPTAGGTSLTKLVSSGSTVISATASATAYIDITDTFLDRGEYYMATCCDSITTTQMFITPTNSLQRAMGIATMNTAFVLPATATIVVPAAGVGIPAGSGISFRATP
jgi:hypothetical protein